MTTTSHISADRIVDQLLGPMRPHAMGQLRRLGSRSTKPDADTEDLHAVSVAQILELVRAGRVRGKLSRAQVIGLVNRVGRYQTLKVIERVSSRRRMHSLYAERRARSAADEAMEDLGLGTTEMQIARMRALPMSTAQIGARLGRSSSAISSRLQRMRERVRDDLD